MPLDEVSAQINDAIMAARAAGPPPTAETAREGYAQLIAGIGTEATASTVEPIEVEGMASLLFTPPDHDDGLLVWLHGGGWVINSPELSRNEVDRLAVAARCRAVSVGYRLAPEHPFPTPQLDAVVATTWCVSNAESLGADPRRVAVAGDSAGGNLAAVAAQRVDDLCAQVLVYPACDLRDERRAAYPYKEGYLLDEPIIDFFMACATGDGDADVEDPTISPALALPDVLGAAPPAMVITAEYDPLRDDARAYAELLHKAGVEVVTRHYERQMHLFFSMPEVIADARDAIEAAGAFLRTRFDEV